MMIVVFVGLVALTLLAQCMGSYCLNQRIETLEKQMNICLKTAVRALSMVRVLKDGDEEDALILLDVIRQDEADG